jgi:hypothetical protein
MARIPEDELVDPWDGHTLEWVKDATGITVNSPSPLLDRREADS